MKITCYFLVVVVALCTSCSTPTKKLASHSPTELNAKSYVEAQLLALQAVQAVLGKTTSSPEFVSLHNTLGLKLISHKECFRYPKHSVPLVTTIFIFRGAGVTIYAEKLPPSKMPNDKQGSGEPVVNQIELIVGDCDECGQFGLWKGAIPVPDLPTDPDSLKKRYAYPESDTLEQRFALLREGAKNILNETRTIDYHFPWQDYDSFPYSFIFNDSRLVRIKIYPSSNNSKVIEDEPLSDIKNK